MRVCSPANLPCEIDRIFQIFSKLGYPKHFIEKVLSKTKNRFNAGAPSQSRNFASGAELLALPFYPKLAKYKSVLETASNVKLIFQYPNTLSKTLIKNSPKQAEVCGGVYRVPCLECEKCYFGETLKSLDVRLKQHKYDISRNNYQNAIFRHMYHDNHAIDFRQATFIFNSKNKNLLQMVESMYISEFPNINLSSGFYTLPNPVKKMLVNRIKNFT